MKHAHWSQNPKRKKRPVSNKQRRKTNREKFLDELRKCRFFWVGKQEEFSYKLSKRNKVFFCNITGNPVMVNYKDYRSLLQKYGTKEIAQEHYISPPYRHFLKKYGRAWLYLHKTPQFQKLKLKLQTLMVWFNKLNAPTPNDFQLVKTKVDQLAERFFIKKIDILLNRTDRKIQGMWLKYLPFVYDMFIPAFFSKNQFNIQLDKIVDESTDLNDSSEIYELPT